MARHCALWGEPWADGTLSNFKERELINVPSAPILVPSVQRLGARAISDLMHLLANIRNRLNFKKENKNDK